MFKLNSHCVCVVLYAVICVSCERVVDGIDERKKKRDREDLKKFFVERYENIVVEKIYGADLVQPRSYVFSRVSGQEDEDVVRVKRVDESQVTVELWLFFGLESSELEDRSLVFWDSVLVSEEGVRAGELLMLRPDAVKIIRLSFDNFDAYLIQDDSGNVDGILWPKESRLSVFFESADSSSVDYSVFKFIDANFEEFMIYCYDMNPRANQ